MVLNLACLVALFYIILHAVVITGAHRWNRALADFLERGVPLIPPPRVSGIVVPYLLYDTRLRITDLPRLNMPVIHATAEQDNSITIKIDKSMYKVPKLLGLISFTRFDIELKDDNGRTVLHSSFDETTLSAPSFTFNVAIEDQTVFFEYLKNIKYQISSNISAVVPARVIVKPKLRLLGTTIPLDLSVHSDIPVQRWKKRPRIHGDDFQDRWRHYIRRYAADAKLIAQYLPDAIPVIKKLDNQSKSIIFEIVSDIQSALKVELGDYCINAWYQERIIASLNTTLNFVQGPLSVPISATLDKDNIRSTNFTSAITHALKTAYLGPRGIKETIEYRFANCNANALVNELTSMMTLSLPIDLTALHPLLLTGIPLLRSISVETAQNVSADLLRHFHSLFP